MNELDSKRILAINKDDLALIVKEVLERVKKETNYTHKEYMGVFKDVNLAIKAAKDAQTVIRRMPMDLREKLISAIREKTIENAAVLAEMGVRETGMGNIGHKILKHKLLAQKTPGTEDITTTAWSGDRGLTLVERGPFGVIGAVTPSTNPSETVICNTIGMIAGGNTVVFNPHPSAKTVSNYAIDMLNKASLSAGGPENIAVSVAEPTLETGNTIFRHADIPLLVATGGPAVVTAVLSTGKRGIGAGAGNPPVFVDDTADIRKAAEDIVNGAAFDNNLPCIAEKEIIAIDSIAEELIFHLKENGCYELDAAKAAELAGIVIEEKNGVKRLNRKCVGAGAAKLLEMIGIEAGPDIRCVIFEGTAEHPLIKEELMMPILGIVRVKTIEEGVSMAKLLEGGNRHSAHMHSKNVDHLTLYGKELDTAIFVKNAPSYSSIGFGGEGFCTFTIASRTGEGLTSAITFTKSRRCVLSDSLCIR